MRSNRKHRNWQIVSFTFRDDVSSKSHYNQHSKRSKGVGNYHISTQGSHKTEESCGHLVQKEIYQELPKKSADSTSNLRISSRWQLSQFIPSTKETYVLPRNCRIISNDIVCECHPKSRLYE